MIKPLPNWVLTKNYPAFYDTESVTAIEMVAKLYGAMQELITDYNKFIDDINQGIEDFENGVNADIEAQNKIIEDAVKYMKDNLIATVTALYEAGFESGDYVSMVGIYYDSEEEELTVEDTLRHAESEEF